MDVTYCYICNSKIETQRTAGDKQKRNKDPATIKLCNSTFIQPEGLDIHPVICSSQECRRVYNDLRATQYLEVRNPYQDQSLSDDIPFFEFLLREDVQTLLTIQAYLANHEELEENISSTLEALLQAWLFSGLCKEILGEFFDALDCVDQTDGDHPVLTLSPLPQAIGAWMESFDRSSEVASNNVSRANQALTIVNNALFNTTFTDVSEESRLFFATVAEWLGRALHRVDPSSDPFHHFAIYFPASKRAKLREFGWCPNEAKKFATSIASLTTRSLFCQLDRRNLRQEHAHCSENDCVESHEALQNHPGPVHRHGCLDRDTCREIPVDQANMKKMCGMLSAGQFPLLRIRMDRTGTADSVEVVPFKEGKSYVAISHVWSQGLGNRLNNSVFQCQLSRLSKLVENLRNIVQPGKGRQELLLWLDTLCCPLQPRKSRDSALRLMR